MNQINQEGQNKKGSHELKPFSPVQQRRMIEENQVGFNEPSIQKMMNQDSLMEDSKTTYIKKGTAVFGVVGATAVK
jgi:hypothetical protein